MTDPSVHPGADLSAYLDGDLDLARREEVAAHLNACAACAAAVADLRGLSAAATALEDRAPAADLWPAIQKRIAARERPGVLPIARRARRVSFTWTQLAAASIALIVIAGGSVWLALSGRTPGTGGPPSAVAERAAAPAGTASVSPVADFADEAYGSAVADLEAALDSSRDRLDPQTVRTIEANLAIIDGAIDDTRRALAADPNSVYLNAHLAEQMQKKLDVLRRATTVASASI